MTYQLVGDIMRTNLDKGLSTESGHAISGSAAAARESKRA